MTVPSDDVTLGYFVEAYHIDGVDPARLLWVGAAPITATLDEGEEPAVAIVMGDDPESDPEPLLVLSPEHADTLGRELVRFAAEARGLHLITD